MTCNTCGKMNCMAHGGKAGHSTETVSSNRKYQKGVHDSITRSDAGTSNAGGYIAGHGYGNNTETAKRLHREKLNESRSLPKPKLKGLAKGGEVDDDKTDMYAMSPDVPAMQGMAEGGEADEMDGIDKELNEMAAGELMEALEKKDKAGILESIKAIVMNCGGKV